MADTLRVLLVDDHAMFRAGIKALLEADGRVTVVGEASTGDEGVDRVRALKPDVVVMDLSMPVMDGLAATQALRAAYPEPRVVMHTASGAEVRSQVAVAGAHALVPKGIRLDELLGCVRAVAVGCACCPYCL
jgi:DNA-binding NarL/FixJ family response regulator